MKRLSELSRIELTNLTEEEVKELIDLECMYNGKPVYTEEPKYLEVPSIPEKDIETFEVAGFVFTDYTEAVKLKDLIENSKSRVRLDYSVGSYDMKYAKNIQHDDYENNITIKKTYAYTKKTYENVKPIISKIREIEKANEEIKESYLDVIESRREIEIEVYETITKAKNNTYEINRAILAYNKYLKLSNNDSSIAMNFFKNSEYQNYIKDVEEYLKESK